MNLNVYLYTINIFALQILGTLIYNIVSKKQPISHISSQNNILAVYTVEFQLSYLKWKWVNVKSIVRLQK